MILLYYVCNYVLQTDMTGLQLQSMEAKSMSDLSKKDSIITALEVVKILLLFPRIQYGGHCHLGFSH